jgi:hypothetical protein
MNISTKVGCILFAMSLGACVPEMPTQEQLQIARDHEFIAISPSRVADALKIVFEASRPGEYEISSTDRSMHARLHWHSFDIVDVGAGEELWSIVLQPSSAGTIASAGRTVRSGDVIFAPDVALPDEAAAYDLLWMRTEYVLGIRPSWVSCDLYRSTMLPPDYPKFQPQLMCSENAAERVPAHLAK